MPRPSSARAATHAFSRCAGACARASARSGRSSMCPQQPPVDAGHRQHARGGCGGRAAPPAPCRGETSRVRAGSRSASARTAGRRRRLEARDHRGLGQLASRVSALHRGGVERAVLVQVVAHAGRAPPGTPARVRRPRAGRARCSRAAAPRRGRRRVSAAGRVHRAPRRAAPKIARHSRPIEPATRRQYELELLEVRVGGARARPSAPPRSGPPRASARQAEARARVRERRHHRVGVVRGRAAPARSLTVVQPAQLAPPRQASPSAMSSTRRANAYTAHIARRLGAGSRRMPVVEVARRRTRQRLALPVGRLPRVGRRPRSPRLPVSVLASAAARRARPRPGRACRSTSYPAALDRLQRRAAAAHEAATATRSRPCSVPISGAPSAQQRARARHLERDQPPARSTPRRRRRSSVSVQPKRSRSSAGR